MEVGQAHQVSAEKQHCLNKQHSKSLSKSKVVYAHDEDLDDTMLIRNFFPIIKEYQQMFSGKGMSTIRNVFIEMLALLNIVELKKLTRKTRYVSKDNYCQLE